MAATYPVPFCNLPPYGADWHFFKIAILFKPIYYFLETKSLSCSLFFVLFYKTMYDLICKTIKILARKFKKMANWYTSPLSKRSEKESESGKFELPTPRLSPLARAARSGKCLPNLWTPVRGEIIIFRSNTLLCEAGIEIQNLLTKRSQM